MNHNTFKRLVLVIVSALSVILLAATVQAQTDIDINDRNMIRIGGDITVAKNQVVENALAVGGDVIVQEGARITQTAIAIGGDVILAEGVRVDGDAYSVGGEVIRGKGAVILGASGTIAETGRWGGGRRRDIDNFLFRYIFGVVSHIFTVVISAIAGVLILRWRPNFLLNLATTLRQYPLQCGLWGLGGIVAVILLVIVLAISLIGIPLLPLIGLAVAVVVMLGTLGVALWLGQITFTGQTRSPIQQFLVGILILGLIGLIPGLGGLVLSVANLFGFGTLLTWQLGKKRPQPAG